MEFRYRKVYSCYYYEERVRHALLVAGVVRCGNYPPKETGVRVHLVKVRRLLACRT